MYNHDLLPWPSVCLCACFILFICLRVCGCVWEDMEHTIRLISALLSSVSVFQLLE